MEFRYVDAVRSVLDHLERTQGESIERAAGLVVDALANRGVVWCHAIGHGNEGDFLNRAGGLAAVQRFSFSFNVTDPVPAALAGRPAPEEVDRELEAVRLAVRASALRAGDVMLVGSVSGRNRVPVELALACRAHGLAVVGLTAVDYTRKIESAHPSGKRLLEACDVAIDIGAPYGDAAVDVPGIEMKVMPVSGVGFTVAGWMIWERVLTRMAAAGNAPTTFMSVNRPEGQERYKASVAQYNERGY